MLGKNGDQLLDWISDEALAKAFSEHNDGRALETLYRRHIGRIYALARRYFSVREDAEEATSETFLRGFRALRDGQFRQDARLSTWLTRIAANVCLERLRQPRLPTLSLDQLTNSGEDILYETGGKRAAGSVDSDSLWAAMESLPDDQRLALTLCDLQGYQAQEAAEILQRSVTATKSLHYRARRSLRDKLEEMQA